MGQAHRNACGIALCPVRPRVAGRPESLRVFGCLPVTARGAARRQASEKPRRRKPRGEYAPGAVSVYGDLRRGSARLGRSRTELPALMGSGVRAFGGGEKGGWPGGGNALAVLPRPPQQGQAFQSWSSRPFSA